MTDSALRTQDSGLRATTQDSGPAFQFNGVVRLTRTGTSYLLLTVVIGFAALNTGNNALYIGLTFMLGCLLLSGLASKNGLKHLSVEVAGISEAWSGRVADGRLLVRNSSRLWNVRDVVITSAELAEPVFLPQVPRRETVETVARFLFQKRGRVQVRKLDLYTRYPFGFFLKKRRVAVTSEVVVFPRLLAGTDERERFSPALGDQSSENRPGYGSELHSFRDYARGDSLRQVSWKKSASLGRWIVRQTDLDRAHVVHVALDPYKPKGVSEEQFEEMISAAATFLHEAAARGLEVVLSLPRVTVRAGATESANAIFRALALLEPTHEPLTRDLDRGTLLFAVGERPAAGEVDRANGMDRAEVNA